jgi:AraC-like DNA-binding protein
LDQEPTSGAAHQPIPVLRYSTEDLAPEDRYRAWLMRDWPRNSLIFRTQPTEPFNTRWETAELGPIAFAYTEITGARWERRLQDIRNSDFDPIGINVMLEGTAQGDHDGRAFCQPAGTLLVHDFARPSLHVSTASRTYSILVPRPIAAQRLAPLAGLHGLVIDGPAAAMLASHVEHVHHALHRVDASLAEGLGQSLLSLAAHIIAEGRPHGDHRLSDEAMLRRRAEEEIERRLGRGDIAVTDLARALGVSRARLFGIFREEGGVHAQVVRMRLERARAALSDAERAEPIGIIAHRLGFSDASHLSRSFRRRYGMTPREYRQLRQADREALAAAGGLGDEAKA